MQPGRIPNPIRAAARAAGERFYVDTDPCIVCEDTTRYTSNGSCVTCARSRGSTRYANMDEAALARQKAKDADRYRRRKQRAADDERDPFA